MTSSYPYNGTVNGYSYEWLCVDKYGQYDYTISDPNGNTIRVNGLTQSDAYAMSRDPKKVYDSCVSGSSK